MLRLTMTLPRMRIAAPVALVMLTAACGSNSPSSTTAPSSPTSFHAEVTDPSGDAVASPGVATAPDLMHGIVDVASGNITFTIQFAPGTLDRQTTLLGFELDTDQDPSTGIPGATGVGIDYHVGLRASSSSATVEKATPSTCTPPNGSSCYMTVGTAPIRVGTDSLTITVSLVMLGSVAGRLNYRVFAYAAPPTAAPAGVADVMPDINLPPARVP
jgi:hypothetical protein